MRIRDASWLNQQMECKAHALQPGPERMRRILAMRCIRIAALSLIGATACDPHKPRTIDRTAEQSPEPAAAESPTTGSERSAGTDASPSVATPGAAGERGVEAAVAVAELQPVGQHGGRLRGTVRFFDSGMMRAEINGATPGRHGIHIHENGDCGDAGKAAGGHWNPQGVPHAGPTSQVRHAGDLGNIEVNAAGVGTLELNLPKQDLVGKAVILHQAADDLTTQPSGNSGDPVGCGVIGKAPAAAHE
jgi:Cu-Zn family superoxide dismutase